MCVVVLFFFSFKPQKKGNQTFSLWSELAEGFRKQRFTLSLFEYSANTSRGLLIPRVNTMTKLGVETLPGEASEGFARRLFAGTTYSMSDFWFLLLLGDRWLLQRGGL